jgi:hypothetical protein
MISKRRVLNRIKPVVEIPWQLKVICYKGGLAPGLAMSAIPSKVEGN